MFDRERFRRGDHEYFEELIRTHGPIVLAVARSFGRDSEHSQDLFQEAWGRVFERRMSYDGRGSFEAWLHRLATNVCLGVLRSEMTRHRALYQMAQERRGEDLVWTPVGPLRDAEQTELQRRLNRAMAHLSDRQYQAVTLRILEGRAPADVARIMSCTKDTVRSHIRHAMRRLRQLWEDQNDEMPGNPSAY